MKLTHSCIITNNLKALRAFYEKVLKMKAEKYGDDYVEFPTDIATLSLFSYEAHEKLAEGSANPSSNRSLELEFLVEDVKQEYERIKTMNIEIVKPLATQA